MLAPAPASNIQRRRSKWKNANLGIEVSQALPPAITSCTFIRICSAALANGEGAILVPTLTH